MLETAVVGLGNVATWHRRGIQRTTGATLTAVADLDESVARERATTWGVESYTTVNESVRDDAGT
jgi:predicted dehydrogenase